jgi:flagellin FlaB
MSGKDRIVNERTNRDDGELGSIGIGAMIVFIALILVAAVASTIIIKTAEELQQNAEQTSSDTRQQISGKVSVVDVIVSGTADTLAGNGADHVSTLDVIWRVSSGSTGIYPNEISYYITCEVSSAVGAFFDTNELTALNLTDDSEPADTFELSAGNTYYSSITLGTADSSGDDSLSTADNGNGCDALFVQGAAINMRIVVDGGGETIAELKVDSLTRGASMM